MCYSVNPVEAIVYQGSLRRPDDLPKTPFDALVIAALYRDKLNQSKILNETVGKRSPRPSFASAITCVCITFHLPYNHRHPPADFEGGGWLENSGTGAVGFVPCRFVVVHCSFETALAKAQESWRITNSDKHRFNPAPG
jgi:hypothetical protein